MTNVGTVKPAVFTPAAVAAINQAYSEACDIISGEAAQEQLRLRLAEYMMYLARNGEIDPERLCSLSVIAVLGRKPGLGDSARI